MLTLARVQAAVRVANGVLGRAGSPAFWVVASEEDDPPPGADVVLALLRAGAFVAHEPSTELVADVVGHAGTLPLILDLLERAGVAPPPLMAAMRAMAPIAAGRVAAVELIAASGREAA